MRFKPKEEPFSQKVLPLHYGAERAGMQHKHLSSDLDVLLFDVHGSAW